MKKKISEYKSYWGALGILEKKSLDDKSCIFFKYSYYFLKG